MRKKFFKVNTVYMSICHSQKCNMFYCTMQIRERKQGYQILGQFKKKFQKIIQSVKRLAYVVYVQLGQNLLSV